MNVTLRDGLHLHVWVQGSGEPLLLLHGFTGSIAAWGGELLAGLSRQRRVIAVDLLGHGESSDCSDPARFAFEELLEDILQVLDTLELASVTWLGYSMGGRLALGAAVRCPHRVSSLILESASPGLASENERRARRRADEALAEGILRGGMEAFVDHWMGLPLFATQGKLPAKVREEQRARRLKNRPDSLAACLRGMGTGAQPSFWEELSRIELPTLLMAGEEDGKFSSIAREMARAMPRARLHLVPRAGHTIHLENPLAWLAAVTTFDPVRL